LYNYFNTTRFFLGPLAKEAIMEIMLSNPIVSFTTSKKFKFSKQATTKQKLLSRLI
jgi:flagellar assembly factor FliW